MKPNLAVITACSDWSLAERALHWPSDGAHVVSRGFHPTSPSISATAPISVRSRSSSRRTLKDGSSPARELTIRFAPVAVAHAKQWRVAPGQPGRFNEAYEIALDNHACDDVGGQLLGG